MKLLELLKKHEWKSVEETILKNYPEQDVNIRGYEKVYNELLTLEPIDTDMSIMVRKEKENDLNIQDWAHVYGIKEGEKETYAIEYVGWEEWINMPILDKSFKNYDELDIISHCMWEMTWGGFSQDEVKEEFQEVNEKIKDFEESIEEYGTKENPDLISMDEIFRQLEDKKDN